MTKFMFSQAHSVARAMATPAVRLKREIYVHAARMRCRGDGPLAVFLPATAKSGAAQLRIFNIAERSHEYGWRSLILPANLTLAQRVRLITATAPDVLVMQGARHALNRPGLYPRQRIIFDMDDADFHLSHIREPLVRAMPNVTAVIAGSDYVADWCQRAGAPAAYTIWTGMPVSSLPCTPQERRSPVVAWSQTRPMTYVKEAEFVLSVTSRLTRKVPDVRLRLYDRMPGDDPAFLDRFRAAGISTEWRPAMNLRDFLASLDDVSLGFAPLSKDTPFSRGKSVGKVLAYLDRRVAILASDAAEHGKVFRDDTAIVSNDPDVWVEQAATLLANHEKRRALADRGFNLFREKLSAEAATRQMIDVFNWHAARYHHGASGSLA